VGCGRSRCRSSREGSGRCSRCPSSSPCSSSSLPRSDILDEVGPPVAALLPVGAALCGRAQLPASAQGAPLYCTLLSLLYRTWRYCSVLYCAVLVLLISAQSTSYLPWLTLLAGAGFPSLCAGRRRSGSEPHAEHRAHDQEPLPSLAGEGKSPSTLLCPFAEPLQPLSCSPEASGCVWYGAYSSWLPL